MSTQRAPKTSATDESTSAAEAGAESANVALIYGALSADPILRELPSGDVVADLTVRTQPASGPALSVPIAWHRPAALIHRLSKGSEVVILGHVARRFFRSKGQVVSRTEVRASTVLRSTQKVACSRAIVAAEEVLTSVRAQSFS